MCVLVMLLDLIRITNGDRRPASDIIIVCVILCGVLVRTRRYLNLVVSLLLCVPE